MLVGSQAVFINMKKRDIISNKLKKSNFSLKFLQIFLLQEAFGPIKLDRGLGYACPYCQKTMPHAAAMKQHIYTHTGEKPYKCTFCSYATNQPGTLNRHVNKLHKENWDLVWNKKPNSSWFWTSLNTFLLIQPLPMLLTDGTDQIGPSTICLSTLF